MIHPTELRLGNLVRLVVDNESGRVNEIAKIVEVGQDKISTEIAGVPQLPSPENLFGIEITSDVLEKCGFTNHSDDHAKFHQSPFWLTKDYDGWRIHYDIANIQRLTAMTYLHQLQNIWIALTGMELTINNLRSQLS